jgi:hypothetical protein
VGFGRRGNSLLDWTSQMTDLFALWSISCAIMAIVCISFFILEKTTGISFFSNKIYFGIIFAIQYILCIIIHKISKKEYEEDKKYSKETADEINANKKKKANSRMGRILYSIFLVILFILLFVALAFLKGLIV